ncbi:unnamed protein product [Linum tenue]|uniref:Uncharacterized protein n=1 Tax=Linum tenue TaxID=586396 RepID=A0AAV0JRS0_9ROSI|nr:unnamed protein product [Linum tenue]
MCEVSGSNPATPLGVPGGTMSAGDEVSSLYRMLGLEMLLMQVLPRFSRQRCHKSGMWG